MKIPQREIDETDMEYIARLTKYTFMLENEVSKYRYVKKRLDELGIDTGDYSQFALKDKDSIFKIPVARP